MSDSNREWGQNTDEAIRSRNKVDQMILRMISPDHWIWGKYNIRYSNSFGHSGWFWDKENKGVTFGSKIQDSFLDVLLEIIGQKEDIRSMSRPAGVIR